MNTQEHLLREMIREALLQLVLSEEMNVVGGGSAGSTKNIGKTTTKDLKGFLDINRLGNELKVPTDKLRIALKDAGAGKRKIPNDKVFADTLLKILGKPKKEKDKIMNIVKKVQTVDDDSSEKEKPKVDVKL